MAIREYAGAAKRTALSGDITAASTTITVADATGYPTGATGPFAIALSQGQAAEEKILVTSRSGNTLTISTRGYDGTTASSHSSGATVDHVLTAIDVREANEHINDTTGDPHSQYLTSAEADALFLTPAEASAAYLSIGGKAADSELLDGLNSTAFQTRDEKGSANGYASLGADGLVPTAQLPVGGAPVIVRKTANEDVVSSTTAQADDELLFPVGAGETWIFDFVLFTRGDAAGDIKIGVQGPTGVAGRYGLHGLDTGATVNAASLRAFSDTTFGGTAPLTVGTTTSEALTVLRGVVVVGATAGNISLVWAQGVSSGNATRVAQHSFLVAQKVA